MNKLSIGVAVAAVAAAGVASAATSDAHGATRDRVLQLTTEQTQNLEIGAPTPDSILGFRVVGADDVYNGSRLVCQLGRSCEAVADLGDQGVSFQCVVTLALQDGTITAQAMSTFTPDETQDSDVAITGGTGAYRHARGHVAVDQLTPTESRLTVDLR